MAAAPPFSDTMAAALALTGMFASDLTPNPPLKKEAHSNPTDTAVLPAISKELVGGSACTLAQLPDETSSWPFAFGKGCFGKNRDGKELPFLERLFLILSFPSLKLPNAPGRHLGEAIRWKSAATLAAHGLPSNTSAFEIVDVPLLEAAVYPQYASGSFNKTCAKWGLYTPAATDGLPAKRLSRECIIVPAARTHMRPLEATATLDDVFARAELLAAPRASSGRAAAALAAAAPRAAVEQGTTSAAEPPMDPAMLAKVLAAVRSMPDVPALSDDQLQTILALAAKPPSAATAESVPQVAPLAPAMPLCTPYKGASPPPLSWQVTEYLGKVPGSGSANPAPPASTAAASSRKRGRTGGVQWGELHVPLWDKAKRQRVSAKAYSGDLHSYLEANPHLEVYNNQDAPPRGGMQLLAGQKLTHAKLSNEREARVVLWDSRTHRKLPIAEGPTPASLCAFLRAHPHVEIFSGQQPPATPLPPPVGLGTPGHCGIDTVKKAAAPTLASPPPFASFANANPLKSAQPRSAPRQHGWIPTPGL